MLFEQPEHSSHHPSELDSRRTKAGGSNTLRRIPRIGSIIQCNPEDRIVVIAQRSFTLVPVVYRNSMVYPGFLTLNVRMPGRRILEAYMLPDQVHVTFISRAPNKHAKTAKLERRRASWRWLIGVNSGCRVLWMAASNGPLTLLRL
jgi:hypothetical protein